MDIRIRVSQPWQTRSRVLPGFISLDWNGRLNDHSVLTVEVEAGSDSEHFLLGEVEVALEVSFEHGRWVEPFGCRFRSQSSQSNEVKQAATRSFDFVGLSSVLDDACVWEPTAGNEEGKRVFGAQSPGTMLGTLIREARARTSGGTRWGQGLTWSFTDSRDSAGQTWGKNASTSFSPSASLFKVLEWLVSKGAIDWRMNGRELQVYRSSGTMSTSIPAPLRHAFATSVPVTVSYENLVTNVLMIGDKGKRWTKDSTAPASAFGRIESVVSHGQVSLDATAELYLQEAVIRGEAPAEQYRREWQLPTPGAPLIFRDYNLGDWCMVEGKRMRIVEAGVSFKDTGEITGWETLGTRRDSILERLARKTTDLSDGMVGGENSPVTIPTPSAVPAAPSGVVASSDGYWEDGREFSRVTVGWNAVTRDTQGRAITVAGYEVNIAGRLARVDDLNAVIDGIGAGVTVRVEVRAVSSDGVLSAPGRISIVTARPDERLYPPTTFALSVTDGIVTVAWDGKLQHANGRRVDPPKHFDRIEVYRAEGATAPGRKVGTVTAGAVALDCSSKIGSDLWFYGVAVDSAGGESEVGARARISVRSLTREAVDAAKARAVEAASKAEGARLEAVKAVSANGKLEAQVAELARNTGDAWNRAVAAAAGSPNVGGAWTDEWACNREITKHAGEFVLSGTPSGESNLVRVLSKTVELVPGRTYRADFTVVNAGRKTVSVDAGFYYESASGWVSSVWGKPRVEIRPGDSAVISNEVTVAYPEGATHVRAVFSGDKDTANQDTHITSGLLTDVTDLVDVQADFDRKITQVSGSAATAGNAASAAQRAADAAKSAAASAQRTADGANTAAGRAQSTADSAKSAADGAKSAADAAARSATQAQATADGKNTVTRSTNTPGNTRGSRAGDVWWRFADNTLTGAIIGQWTWNGSAWKPALIDSAIIASLTVDKLAVTGGATFPVAVIDTLVGDDAFFKNLYSNRLLVAPGNLVADGWGENGGKFWPTNAGEWNGNWFVTNSGQGGFYLDIPQPGTIAPGRYRLEVQAATDKPGMALDVNVDLHSAALSKWTAVSGGHSAGGHAVVGYTFTGTGYSTLVSEVEVTGANERLRRVWIRPNSWRGTVTDGKLWVRVRLKAMVGVVDIADGAVTADKVLADQALVNKLITPSLLAGKIETSMFSTQAGFEGDGVRIDRGGVVITGGGKRRLDINPGQGIKVTDANGTAVFKADMSGSVTLKGSITAGSTVTGAQVQTGTSGARLLLGSNGSVKGLFAFDSNNRERIRLVDSGLYFTDDSGHEGLRIFSYEADSIPQGQLEGPAYGNKKAIIRLGRTESEGASVPYAAMWITYGNGSWWPDTSRVQVWGNGAWQIGGKRGFVKMENASGEVMIRSDAQLVSIPNLPTESSGGNNLVIKVSGSGRHSLYRITSLRAHKADVQPLVSDPYAVLGLRECSFLDKTALKHYEDGQAATSLRAAGERVPDELALWEGTAYPHRAVGLIAEEVEETGLEGLPIYDEAGNLSGVNYERLSVYLLHALRALKNEVDTLKQEGTVQ